MTTATSERQIDLLAEHLRKHKSISPAEAKQVYGIERLAARMLELKGVVNYRAERRTDPLGKRYTRYFFLGNSKL